LGEFGAHGDGITKLHNPVAIATPHLYFFFLSSSSSFFIYFFFSSSSSSSSPSSPSFSSLSATIVVVQKQKYQGIIFTIIPLEFYSSCCYNHHSHPQCEGNHKEGSSGCLALNLQTLIQVQLDRENKTKEGPFATMTRGLLCEFFFHNSA
jgi:hypothetical protein